MPRARAQGIFILAQKVFPLYTLIDDLPGEQLISTALTVKIKRRFKADFTTCGFQAGALGEKWQSPANPTVATGQKTLELGMAQRFEVQLDIRQ